MFSIKMLNPHHTHIDKKLHGMTLIEVLICIIVIGVGILAIAKLMSHNIETIAKVHDRTTATTLAREGLEMLTNIRDTNMLLGYERNCAQRNSPKEIEKETEDMNTKQSPGEQVLCKSFFWTGDNTNYNYTIDGGLQSDIGQIVMTRIADENLLSGSSLYMTGLNINGASVYGYTHKHNDTEKASPFSRYIQFSPLSGLVTNSPLSPNDIHIVRSIVLYQHNDITGQVMLESFIANQE